VCCQFEIIYLCVLKPGEGNYLQAAKPVITVTRSALRLPVSNPLLQLALAWPVCPSSSVQDDIPQLVPFLIVSICLLYALFKFYTHETLYILFMVTNKFCFTLDCSCVVKAHVPFQGARLRTHTVCVLERLGGKMPTSHK